MNGSLCDKHGKFYVLTRIRGEDGKLRKKWIPTGISSNGNTKNESDCSNASYFERVGERNGQGCRYVR